MRHHRRGGQIGVTLVELLVTIVVAGIFFAAIVPVFVLAQKTSSGDKARLVAMNVAQSRIELIRELPFVYLTTDFLNGGSVEATVAGIDTSWAGEGDGKTYVIAYEVERVFKVQQLDGTWSFQTYSDNDPDLPNGVEDYRLVTVRVDWQGQPTPQKTAVLSIAVYRQFTGSEITRMIVSPLTALPTGELGIRTATGPVTIAVDINPVDWEKTDHVTFTVQAANGQVADTAEVVIDHETDPGTQVSWDWTWDAASPPRDGLYTFIAVATTDKGEDGNVWRLTYPLETGPPPAPTGLGVIRGDGKAILQWEPPNANDLTSYEVTRYTVVDGVRTGSVSWGGLPVWTSLFVDRSADSATVYEYEVRAHDLGSEPGDYSSPATAAALDPMEDVAPDPPTRLQLVADGQNITVTWEASPSSDVTYYCVYRDPGSDFRSPIAIRAVGETFRVDDLRAGWNTTHHYEVRAMDVALNESGSAAADILIPAAPVGETFDLAIKVNGYGAQVTVESLAGYLSYPLQSVGSQNEEYVLLLNSGQKRTTKDMPYGWYRVTVAFEGPTSVALERRILVQDIELFRNTTLEYTAPTS
jgi:type II secretory pathway pseudopilin PulG